MRKTVITLISAISIAAGGGLYLLFGASQEPSEIALLSPESFFSDRDLRQEPDLASASELPLQSGQSATISQEGVYLLRGSYTETTIVVETDDQAKVQLVLDQLTIENAESPAVYVKSADKVFITTLPGKNSLSVTGEFVPSDDTNLDSVIFSRSDLTLNGQGQLAITSSQGNGISSKDDLKITGGTMNIYALEDGLEANDSIRIGGGAITIESKKDALHAENDDDPNSGYIYVGGGKLTLNAADDAMRGSILVKIDDGSIDVIDCSEGIEATHVQINGGDIKIYSRDDGINATRKGPGPVMIEVNGGNIAVKMAAGDTDAFDSNGDLYIRDGVIDVEARSAFDADGTSEMTGGNVTVNGEVVTEIKKQRGGPGGGWWGGDDRKKHKPHNEDW
ncbi:carbohydrate-binding domain-containing protein [Pelagicoccus albus]|uniref:Carbohydrate-binding domain-containing protein n=1 Tax=Pelagicoccus albus TaxID=415222 RepID=A0A7X1E8T5_9BACT|nr:carbohydrate-binding domain-containing protein [Pelagicoccus albus]MBC2607100.1 carbohydrate-binding domain-containing protein [Pelagicoccus albus]